MAISRDEVEHVAYLARLGLTEDEKRTFQEQLSGILDYMRALGELDTSAIPPGRLRGQDGASSNPSDSTSCPQGRREEKRLTANRPFWIRCSESAGSSR